MAIRYIKPGEDFHFDPAFGFTGSAAGRKDARNHPADADDNEYGDGSYVENPPKLAKEKAKGGPIRRAQGGDVDPYDVAGVKRPPSSQEQIDAIRMRTDMPQYGKPVDKARGGRAPGKPSTAHMGDDPKGYADGGAMTGAPMAPTQMPGGRPMGVPDMGGAPPPGMASAAGPMARAPAPINAAASPLAQRAQSGPLDNATMTMPVHDAARLAHGLVQAGRVGGIRQAIGNAGAARGAAMGRMAAMSPGAAGAPAAAAPQPPQQQGIPAMAHGGHHITAAQRHRLPSSEFGLPAKEGYPIDTPGRARSALSRASANASPAEQAEIRRKVHARYPSIGKK